MLSYRNINEFRHLLRCSLEESYIITAMSYYISCMTCSCHESGRKAKPNDLFRSRKIRWVYHPHPKSAEGHHQVWSMQSQLCNLAWNLTEKNLNNLFFPHSPLDVQAYTFWKWKLSSSVGSNYDLEQKEDCHFLQSRWNHSLSHSYCTVRCADQGNFLLHKLNLAFKKIGVNKPEWFSANCIGIIYKTHTY